MEAFSVPVFLFYAIHIDFSPFILKEPHSAETTEPNEYNNKKKQCLHKPLNPQLCHFHQF